MSELERLRAALEPFGKITLPEEWSDATPVGFASRVGNGLDLRPVGHATCYRGAPTVGDYHRARSAIAAHPADDDDAEPVTGDWLTSVGFTRDHNGNLRRWFAPDLKAYWTGNSVMLGEVTKHFTTRGEVRKLCELLTERR